MANLLPTLNDHDFRNWVKGGLGLKFARDGIENFVQKNIDQFHQDILNSLSAQCNNCSTANIIQCKYNNNFCRFSKNQCLVHDHKDPNKISRPCPRSVCNVVRDDIVNKHRFSGPSWRNTDSSLWCRDPWQLATCYMSAGYAASSSASETDFPGLLAVIINNKVFDTEVTDNLINKNNVFDKARDARNAILHKPDMRLTDTELAGYIATLDAMLSDSKCLAGHPSAIQARALLQQILNDTLSVSTVDTDAIRADALRAIQERETEALDSLHEKEVSSRISLQKTFNTLKGTLKQERKEAGTEIQKEKIDATVKIKSELGKAMTTVRKRKLQATSTIKFKAKKEKEDLIIAINSKRDAAFAAIETKEVSSIAAVHKAKDKAKCRADEALVAIETKEVSSIAAVHKAEHKAKFRADEALVGIETKEVSSIAAVHKAEVEATSRFESASKESHDRNAKALKKELLSVYHDGEHMSTSLGPVDTDEDIHIDKLYVTPDMKHDGKPVKSYQDIFKPQNKKVYIVGEAGTGKTSLCQNIVSTWCQINTTQIENMSDSQQAMTKFDYLFYISLREVITDNTIDEMIIHHLLPNKPSLHEPLSRVLEEENCLIILDGLDEWTTENKTAAAVNRGLPGRDAVRNCTVLTTTRPWKLESLHIKSTQIDMRIELLGIDKISSGKLIWSMIYHLNDKFYYNKTYKNFISELKDMELDKLMTIPVILKQIVCLWYSGKKIGKSKSAIYSQMLELQFELAQKRLIEDSYFRHEKENWIKSSIKLPPCFDDNGICQEFKPLILALSQLAFHTLLSDNHASSLVFKSTKAGCHNLSPEEVKICLKIGILSQTKILIDCTSQYKIVSFLHKTYQEFLAAMFVSLNQSDTKQCVATLLQFCSTEDKYDEMLNVVIFISGLYPSDITCTLLDHYHTLWDDNDDDYEEGDIQSMIIDCMREGWTCSHDNKHLYCVRITIDEPSEYLDQLCQVNIPNIEELHIFSLPTSQYLQYLLQIHTLKRLFISSTRDPRPSEDLLYTLVHHHRHTLTYIYMEGMTLRSNNRLPTLITQISHLWRLIIWGTILPQQLLTSVQALHSPPDRHVDIVHPTILPDTKSTD